MRTPDLDQSPIIDLARRIQRLERQAALGFSSITRGSLRVASVEGLIVEGSERVTGILVVDGTLQVAGTQTVSGTLVISGGQIINGTFVINGPTGINGALTIAGVTTITGALSINGATTITGGLGLTGTMTISGGGKISVGGMEILPAVGGGGGGLYSPSAINVQTPVFDIQGSLGVDQSIVAPNLPIAPPGTVANLYVDPSNGAVKRIL